MLAQIPYDLNSNNRYVFLLNLKKMRVDLNWFLKDNDWALSQWVGWIPGLKIGITFLCRRFFLFIKFELIQFIKLILGVSKFSSNFRLNQPPPPTAPPIDLDDIFERIKDDEGIYIYLRTINCQNVMVESLAQKSIKPKNVVTQNLYLGTINFHPLYKPDFILPPVI